jgi:predicted O-methyltransferase YrrM
MSGYSSIKLAAKYANYLIKAKKLHGVHSPLAYDFSEQLLYPENSYYAFDTIEELRRKLLIDKRQITVTDFGAGSRIFKSNTRSIHQMAKHVLLKPKYGQLLFRMIEHYRPKTIVELGTSLGITSLYLGLSHKDVQVYTFEGCPEIGRIAKENWQHLNATIIHLVLGDFEHTLREKLNEIPAIDFAYIDGNHTYRATIDYFKLFMDKSSENTILVFDDIHLSEEMEQAWEEIKSHPKVSCTIDLFKIGVVFLRKGKVKEDFVLWY